MSLNFEITKIFILTTLAFILAFVWTPLLLRLLNKYKFGKKIRDEASAPIFSKLHQSKSGTPTMGGVLIWLTVLVLALFFFYVGKIFPGTVLEKLNFLTRPQTFLPLGALVASALVGLFDDWLNIRGIGSRGGGMKIRYKLIIYTLIALVGAWWFYFKLDWTIIHLPFIGNYVLGFWYVPIFIFVIVATAFSVNEIDGLDGLAGGTLLAAFGTYGAIAFIQVKYDLAALCGVIVGALVAFLWYNINPAKFFMGDTGAMSLGVTLGIIAMLTNYALLLPIIGLLFVVEALSVIIQLISKKVRKKKIFLSTPIHHHFEAKGWGEPTIVMRFWLIGGIMAVVGLIIALLDRGW